MLVVVLVPPDAGALRFLLIPKVSRHTGGALSTLGRRTVCITVLAAQLHRWVTTNINNDTFDRIKLIHLAILAGACIVGG